MAGIVGFMATQSVTRTMSESASGEASSSNTDSDKESSVCPTCGQSCKSKKGLRQHHKRSHGESIAKATVDCNRCGEEHKRWKSQMNGGPYYCSQSCRIATLNENQDPDYNRKIVSCGYCGTDIERRMSRINRAETLYCSRDCADKDHSDRMSGAGNPKWVGGYDGYYGEDWPEQRDKARDRDNYICRRCGVSESELGHELSVHHKVPFRKFDDAERANQLSNLISLCTSCHTIVEAWPVQPQ